MTSLLRTLFFYAVARPLVLVFLGLNVRHGQRIPRVGPAVIIANHNSHLDTLVLMTLFPLSLLPRLRPVAAADYFSRSRALEWFTTCILNAILIERQGGGREVLGKVGAALAAGDIILLYPEGSRGEPERLSNFRSGVAHLLQRHPEAAVTPVFLHGLGKALPKNDWLPVPFFVDVFVGEPLRFVPDAALTPREQRSAFMASLNAAMHALASEGHFPPWE